MVGGAAEQDHAVAGGQERRLVDAVGDPVQVPLDPADVVALGVGGRAERRAGTGA
jgi:ABC-type Fe3+-hydroxamate transport system substrate-binding protein